MSMTINGTSGLVFNDASTQNTAATGFGFKNRIINGAMMIDQRNAGASVTTGSLASANLYTLDRWFFAGSQNSKFTVQQSSDAPTGFSNSLLVTSTSAYSVTGSDFFILQQAVEGFNTADLGWGTASASTVTLSFWVKSSLTGTFGAALQNNGYTRSYPFSYTISAANTWEQKTVTIAGDTSGTWIGATNGVGLRIDFSIGCAGNTGGGNAWVSANYFQPTGSTSVVGTNGATWRVTGVQLEKGSTATSFDYRPYGTELALCQRYAYILNSNTLGGTYRRFGNGVATAANTARMVIPLSIPMRATPSLAFTSDPRLETGSGASNWSSVASVSGTYILTCDVTTVGNFASTNNAIVCDTGSSGTINITAEL